MNLDFLVTVLHNMKTLTKVNRNNASNIVLVKPKLIK